MKVRARVVLEAEQFDGKPSMCVLVNDRSESIQVQFSPRGATWSVPPGHGLLVGHDDICPLAPGDWIITGVTGVRFVCPAAEFAAEYEVVYMIREDE